MPQLSASEILSHPSFGKWPWEGDPAQKGRVDVAASRGGPVSLEYEVYGKGKTKLLVGLSFRFLLLLRLGNT